MLEQLACLVAGHLILQRKRADYWIAGVVIAALRYLGGQNAKSGSEREGSDDDYTFGQHGRPPSSRSPYMRNSLFNRCL